MNKEEAIIKAYSGLFTNHKRIHKNEEIAKDALQNTILRILTGKKIVSDEARSITSIIKWMANAEAREISRGRFNVARPVYEASLPMYSDETEGDRSILQIRLDEMDFGQISSVFDKMQLIEIKDFLGEEFGFYVDHLDFTKGRSGMFNGVRSSGVGTLKIFDNDSSKYRHNYLKKKLKARFLNGRLS